MKKLAFISDSGTGSDVRALREKGIFSVPLQVSYDNQNYHDLEDVSIDKVYELMRNGKMLATSLPALGKIEELFYDLKQQGYEGIFAVPICSGLSGTINALHMSAESIGLPFDYIDCHVTAVVQEYLITLAKDLYENDKKSIDEIKIILNEVIASTNTLLLPDDLQHLKRGGRLTPLAATLGGLLKIKPILQINQKTLGKIDVVDKVRTMHKAMDKAIDLIAQDGVDETYHIIVAHADALQEGNVLREKLQMAFPQAEHRIQKLVSVVGVHTGRGCLAIQYFKPYHK